MLEDLLKRAKTPERRAEIESQLDGPGVPDGFEYLLGWFYDVGPAETGGMGPAPLSYSEIRAWRLEQGIELNPWEARILRVLSASFCAARGKKKG